MKTKETTNKPYKIQLPTQGNSVNLIILDTYKDEILYCPFEESESLAENLLHAMQYAIQQGAKLKELQFVIKN